MSEPSNTLILTGFDRDDFPSKVNNNGVKQAEPTKECLTASVRRFLESEHSLHIVHWAELKSFGRVLIVFPSAPIASTARDLLHSVGTLFGKSIRAAFTHPTPLYNECGQQYLELPSPGRLFFISPPPSPPAGWVSTMEEEPNTETFHTDLHEALLDVQNKVEGEFTPNNNDISPFPSTTIRQPDTGKLVRRVTLHGEGGSSPTDITPSIVLDVNDDDDDDDNDNGYDYEDRMDIDRERFKIIKTGLPPMQSV